MSLDLIIDPRSRDLGDGMMVRRILPYAKRRMVGPFIFLDEMGPATFAPGKGIDVRPHPHIGLATVTYLFDGAMLHQDSTGAVNEIVPGDVNWMTAGRGISHSERTSAEKRASGQYMHGLQAWVALPNKHEMVEPSFQHHPAETLPSLSGAGVTGRVIAGSFGDLVSPVHVYSPLFYVHADLDAGASIRLPADYSERAVCVVDGAVEADGDVVNAKQLGVFKAGGEMEITAREASRIALLGGEPVGERLIWWNFVASTKERMEQGKADWRASAEQGWTGTPFTLPAGDSDEFIPLPDETYSGPQS